jgi:CheY-like chemotaxis protein
MADRVLIADDEEASRKGLKALLTNWGTRSGHYRRAEALEKAATFLAGRGDRRADAEAGLPALLAQLRTDLR